jgi:hypothetical protein
MSIESPRSVETDIRTARRSLIVRITRAIDLFHEEAVSTPLLDASCPGGSR